MSKFPLYDSLSKNIPNTDLTVAQKKMFVKKIEKIDKNGHELVYALVRMYQVENKEENINFALPYTGVYVDGDISFNLDNFPISLRHILFRFLNVHIEKMREETILEKNTPVKRV